MQAYTIKLEAFEGPLDLLMHLIEKNKIDLHDIPIASLTEQYMEYLAKFKEFNIEIASEFLVMAATLLQIKSRMLLPKYKPEAEAAEDEEEDPRQELVDRLLEYRRFKEVSMLLDQMAQEKDRFFSRPPTLLAVSHLPPENMDVQLLWQAFQTVLEAQVPDEITIVCREKFSVQDKMAEISFLLRKKQEKILFSEAFTEAGSRAEIIATFLALLELMKLKRVLVEQTHTFADIYIKVKDEDHVLC